MRRTIKKKVLD